jgi:hypothetical protein
MNNVRKVLTPAQWKVLSKTVYDAAYSLCQICGGVGPKHPVECHEIWHYNDKTLVRTLIGMISLCPDCHMVKHFGLATIQGKQDRALAHLMKVNGLKKREAEEYIVQAFETWNKRSKKQWTLDLSLLEQYGIDLEKLKEEK